MLLFYKTGNQATRHPGMDCRDPDYRDVSSQVIDDYDLPSLALDTRVPPGMTVRGGISLRQELNMTKQPCVYILSSQRNGTLYVGVTSDLIKRVFQHRMEMVEGFTKRYGVHDLVWYELHQRMDSAILREKQLKKWSRLAKIRLIEKDNQTWQDLLPGLM